MCAILGMLHPTTIKAYEKELEKLWKESENRGKDSLGFYAVNPSGKAMMEYDTDDKKHVVWVEQIFKEVTHPTEFYGQKKAKFFLENVEVFLGHTRQATTGDCSLNKNNHPFTTKDLCWSHNGIISNYTELKKKHNLSYDSECDSAVIGHLTQKFLNEGMSIEKAIEKTGEELSGGFSVWMVHRPTRRIFVFRNSSNPFEYTTLKDGTFLFSSVQSYLRTAFTEVINTTSSTPDTVFELVPGETSFSLKEVGKFPKVTQPSYPYGKKNGNIPVTHETYKSPYLGKSQLPQVVGEKMMELGKSYNLDGYIAKKIDGTWVLSTKQYEFAQALDATTFIGKIKTIQVSGSSDYKMLNLTEAEMEDLVEQLGRYFHPVSEDSNFLTYFCGLKGISVVNESTTKVTFRVSNGTTNGILQKCGVVINKDDKFTVRGKTPEKLEKWLLKLQEKINNLLTNSG